MIERIGCTYYHIFIVLLHSLSVRLYAFCIARLKGIWMTASKTWIALGTIASPATGTLFSKILTPHNHKYILWYNGEKLFKPGDEIHVCHNRLFVNDELRDINILQIDKYSHTLWRVMHNMSSCPGHRDPENKECIATVKCIFKRCPYGKVRVSAT